MKIKFRGYYHLSDQELEDLWQNCIFVFDANVLLNFYRYSSGTATEFINLLEQISNRIWVPFQAAYEFQQRRLDVISQQEKSYDDALSLINKARQNIKDKLLSDRHPFIENAKQLIDKLEEILGEIESQLIDRKDKYKVLNENDEIRHRITDLFDGKVGDVYTEQKLEEIYRKGKKRYDQKIPPGYEDAKHKEGNKIYGDLILWLQTIDKGKSDKKPIILITDEKKHDWWWKNSKEEIVSPRPELIKEMLSETSLSFYMYRADRFLELIRKYLSKQVNQKAIDEVKEIRKRDEKFDVEEFSRNMREVFAGSHLAELAKAVDTSRNMREAVAGSSLAELAKTIDLSKNLREAISGPSLADLAKEMDVSRKLREDIDIFSFKTQKDSNALINENMDKSENKSENKTKG